MFFLKNYRRSSSDRETRKQEVRDRLERGRKKKGFMTPERKKKLRVWQNIYHLIVQSEKNICQKQSPVLGSFCEENLIFAPVSNGWAKRVYDFFFTFCNYRIPRNSFLGNYTFLKVENLEIFI